MQYSDYYNLRKPQMAETASVNDLNYNTDRIDAIMADNRQISVAMYVSGNTYNTGDLVGYENAQNRIHIYKCLEDNVTGSWDATKWDITTLADEVLEAKASGGTEVEANPAGTPTDTLETIGIDGVVYGVEGGGGGGGSSTLAGLTDVNLATPADGQFLVYDETNEEWVNGNIAGVNLQPVIYSTEEREVGVWTDGKPLYQKTFLLSLKTIRISQWTSTGINATGIERLVDCCLYYASTGASYYPQYSRLNANAVEVYGVVSEYSYDAVTLQYTKTTDAPGSGTWTPQGVPAVHYSTDEQVVGTINGTTLYEKLVTTNGAVPTGATLVLRTPLSNGYDNLQYTY